MKLIGIGYLLIFVLYSTSAYAADMTNTDCSAERTAPITLSSREQNDTLTLKASGSPCIKGSIVVAIAKKDGKGLYREVLRIENLYVNPAGVPISDIEKALDRIIRNGSMTTGSWPSYVSKPQPINIEGEYSYSVSKEEYNRLRKKDIPAFRLWTYYEVFTNLIYDEKKDTVLSIWDWGL